MTALLIVLALLAVTAPRWGADTRDGRDWQPGSWSPGLLSARLRR